MAIRDAVAEVLKCKPHELVHKENSLTENGFKNICVKFRLFGCRVVFMSRFFEASPGLRTRSPLTLTPGWWPLEVFKTKKLVDRMTFESMIHGLTVLFDGCVDTPCQTANWPQDNPSSHHLPGPPLCQV